ncbi:hypothetical protein [Rhizobium leguminosarum]|uniref:hypothetical protein n=2 Tax=Rhizobium TaxID=379 RepID=UPI00102FE958|nr:hypothetical protein [Rhizobium leguminosarum]TAY69316.1 hypothetical protein ELH82_25520 [Rhizobium leguminosarum]
MNPVIWTSKDIITAVIATGLVAAAFREFIELVKVRWRKQSEVQYLCVSAAVALEAFALECRELKEMMEAAYHQRGAVGSISVPSPPKLPPDCNWRLIDITLMNELLSFENMVRKAQIDADFAAHFEGNTWAHASEVAALMEKAKALASQLRTNVGLS